MKKLFAFLFLLSMITFYGCSCPYEHGYCHHFNHQHHMVYHEPAEVTETTIVHTE